MKSAALIVRLAWRNVWRNKRRTVLTLMTVLVGSAMIIFMNAFAKGGHDQMIEDAVSVNTGHIQVHERGYWENRTIDYAFKADDSLVKRLRGDRRVASCSTRVNADGLLYHGDATAGAMIQAVDPQLETRVTDIHDRILPGGRYLAAGDRKHIVMGHILAKNLGAAVGSTVSLISQGFDGSIAAEKLTVVGLLNSGNPEYDRALVIMLLAQAEETFTMMGFVHSLVIRLSGISHMEGVLGDLRALVDGKEVEVMGWDDLMPELVQFIVMDDVGAYIFDFILFMVVAFGILNTIQMSVFERTREFGVMLSIGTSPGQVVGMVLCESFMISVLGVILGLSLGTGLGHYFKIHPLDYSSFSKEMAVWGISTTMFPADVTLLNVSVTSAVTLALSLLFSLFPARRASKLNPVEAIRHL